MRLGILVVALATMTSGCVSVRTCELRTQRAVGQTLLNDSETTRLTVAWQAEYDKQMWEEIYCKMLIGEEIRIGSLSGSGKISIPKVCARFLKGTGYRPAPRSKQIPEPKS